MQAQRANGYAEQWGTCGGDRHNCPQPNQHLDNRKREYPENTPGERKC